MSKAKFEPVYFLIVDDLDENLLALEALLRRDGLTVLKAKSGNEALELLLKFDVALALIDVQMPEMNGFELAELMRGIAHTRDVPIIFLTAAHEDKQRRFRGYEAGAVDFLHKPIEPDVLKSKAGVFFELSRRRQEVVQHIKILQDTDRRKDEFLATLAHELRNPLAPISNGLEILQQHPTDDVAENVRAVMKRQLAHLVRLIDDLLDTSRISKGKIELRRAIVDIQSIIQDAIETSRPQIEQSRHSLTVNIPEIAIGVNADATRMAQVIGNLLNNAAKYTPEGGKIHLSVVQNAGEVVVKVSDNGIGIPAQMLGQVFDLFTQAHGSSRGGLGIGLSLVQHLVRMHDGRVYVESDGENKGSTFTVSLPSVEYTPLEHFSTPDQPLSLNAMKILIVDDNVASAQTIAWMLEALGHASVQANTGQEALDIVDEVQPNVILLDIGLPDMTGYDVCRALRLKPNFKNTLIIAQTGWGQKKDRDLAQEAGFSHHLIKPIKLEELEQLLSNAASEH